MTGTKQCSGASHLGQMSGQHTQAKAGGILLLLSVWYHAVTTLFKCLKVKWQRMYLQHYLQLRCRVNVYGAKLTFSHW